MLFWRDPLTASTVMTPPDYWAISQGDPDYGYKVLFQKDDWNCSGSAKLYDKIINVCPDINSATGYSYFLMPVEADDDLSFNAMYTVRMDYTDICADGIAFVLCSDMATNGPKGKYMGYGGVTPSLVVEMDNFKNDGQHKDENGEGDWVSGESSGHIAVMLDGNSLNHYAYGSIVEWIYRYMCGLDYDENHPGFARFTVKPYTDERFDWAKMSYRSAKGLIRCEWTKKDNGILYTVEVPFDTEGEFVLSKDATSVTVNGSSSDIRKAGEKIRLTKGTYTIFCA